MLILGIDPGTAITGYGLVECIGNRHKMVDYGCVYTKNDRTDDLRLQQTYEGIRNIIQTYQPQAVAVEELFFNKNVRTALAVGQARGVILLATVHEGLSAAEYTPLQVKQAVVGYGRAEKKQVQFMVKTLLNLPEIPRPDDAADALAIALCHSFARGLNDKLAGYRK